MPHKDEEEFQVDNELFTRNHARFLRRMLQIAAGKEDRWWYVKRMLGDERIAEKLRQEAPPDEVRFYESISKRIGGVPEPVPLPLDGSVDGVEEEEEDLRAADVLKPLTPLPHQRQAVRRRHPSPRFCRGWSQQEARRPRSALVHRPTPTPRSAVHTHLRPRSAQPAGGAVGAARVLSAEDPPPAPTPFLQCWNATTGALQKLRDMADAVDSSLRNQEEREQAAALMDVHTGTSNAVEKKLEGDDGDGEEDFVIFPTPLKRINGHPKPTTEESVWNLKRKASLNGGCNMFSDTLFAGEPRSRRWRPCFAAFEKAERCILKLEQIWIARSRDCSEHPPAVAEKDKEAVLGEGLGSENDELSAFLTTWASDLEQRLRVLVMYETIRAQTKGCESVTRGVQTDGNAGVSTLHPKADKPGQNLAETTAAASPREGGSPQTSFVRSMKRIAAAIRIQSLWRGFAARVVVGSFAKKRVTFFHSQDERVRQAWVRCSRVGSRMQTQSRRWLSGALGRLVNARITARYAARADDSLPANPLEFVDFFFGHAKACHGGDDIAATRWVEHVLLSLQKYLEADLMYAVLSNLLLCVWGPPHANLLASAVVRTEAVVNKLPTPAFHNPSCNLETEISLSTQQLRTILRLVFGEGVPKGLVSRILQKCKAVGQYTSGGVTTGAVSQKEFYYCLLLMTTPDVLESYGFGPDVT